MADSWTKWVYDKMARKSWEWPPHEEVVATSMLLGEPAPVICSCCLGKHGSMGIFSWSSCGQCGGCGYDIIGPSVAVALGYEAHEVPQNLRLYFGFGEKR